MLQTQSLNLLGLSFQEHFSPWAPRCKPDVYVCMEASIRGHTILVTPCMHACMHACMYICMYACMHVLVCVCVCLCTYVCICVYVCTFVGLYLSIYLSIYLLVYLSMYLSICLYVDVNIQCQPDALPAWPNCKNCSFCRPPCMVLTATSAI